MSSPPWKGLAPEHLLCGLCVGTGHAGARRPISGDVPWEGHREAAEGGGRAEEREEQRDPEPGSGARPWEGGCGGD